MQLSNIPSKLVLPWATSGNKNNIPVASQIGITAGAASLTDGFPPLTMTPVAAGGVPPSGLDMNGILYEMSNILRWANAGGGYAYDSDFANDSHVGGYPKGARVMRSDGMGYWFNTVDNNTTDPEAAGAAAAGWVPDYQAGATSVAMSGSSVTLTPAQYGKPLIVITGALSANLNLIFPDLAQGWTVINNTTGGYSITAKTASGSGVALGTVSQIVGDGTNIYAANPDSVQIVTNVATLRNIPPTLSRRVQTRGYYTDGDGGSGQYFPKVGAAPGTYVHNGGTVIVPNGGDGSAAWLLDIQSFVTTRQFGCKADNVTNDTAPFQAAVDWSAANGIAILVNSGTYALTNITLRHRLVMGGEGRGLTLLRFTNPSAGSAFIRPNDNVFFSDIVIRDMSIGTAFSSVSAAQDANPNLIGINLAGCAFSLLENLSFGGFGSGAIVLARTENGAEGLGFTNSTLDSNYNTINNVYIASCGKYNEDGAALWLKYKANSNTLGAVWCKGGIVNAFVIAYGNDNYIFGGTAESTDRLAYLKSYAVNNTFAGMRAEGMGVEVYKQDDYYTQPWGHNNLFLNIHASGHPQYRTVGNAPPWEIGGARTASFKGQFFTSNLSQTSDNGYTDVAGLLHNEGAPIRIKTSGFNSATGIPLLEIHNTHAATVANQELGGLIVRNSDSTPGAPGINARVVGITDDGVGNTAIGIFTGVGGVTTEKLRVQASGTVRPGTDNAQTLGAAANRWSVVYAGTGTINTSDEREKQQIKPIDAAALAAWGKVEYCQFKFNDAVHQKGDGARWHFGLIAQRVKDAFESEGIDAFEYGVLCFDEWEEQTIPHAAIYDFVPTGTKDDNGDDVYVQTLIKDAWVEIRPAGSRYGVRYEEALALECAYLRSKL